MTKETDWYRKLEEKFGEVGARILTKRLVGGLVAIFVFIILPFPYSD